MLVFTDHVLETFYPEFREANHFGHYIGRLGVLLFFVHTSRVLMSSMDRIGSAKAFYIRRIFRIYPLAIFTILLIVAFQIPQVPWKGYAQLGWVDLTSNFLLTQNLTSTPSVVGPMWSLPLEVQMYAFLPLIFFMRRYIWPIFGLSVLGAIFIAPLSDVFSVFRFAPCFVAGVIAYTSDLRSLPAWGWFAFLAAVVCVYVGVEMVTPGIHHVSLQIATTLAVGLAIPCFQQSRAWKFNRVTNLLAKYSYGIYLFHCIALWIAPNLILAVVFTAVMSVASFHLIENPMIKWGGRVASWKPMMETVK